MVVLKASVSLLNTLIRNISLQRNKEDSYSMFYAIRFIVNTSLFKQ